MRIKHFKILITVLSFVCIHSSCTQAADIPTVKNNDDSVVLSIFSNGYAYPVSGDQSAEYISEQGITGWNNAGIYFRIFFYVSQAGEIHVSLKLKSINNSNLKLQLDSAAKSYDMPVNKSSDYNNVSAGSFEIKNAGYHFIQITAINKTGNYFPDIESLILTTSGAQNIQCNTSEYRGAPSTHLWYDYPKDSAIAWFYNEVTVPVGVNAVNAYYMTNGFNGGYMGVQVNSPTEKRFIFSIWSNYNTNNPKKIPAEYAVKLIKKGKDVYADDFGNEGSGGHSHLVFKWKNGQTYKLLIGAKAAGDHTIYTAYYFAPENKEWRLIAEWDQSKNGGKLLSGLYSFVENFGSNGNDYFKADYGNQWICTTSGTWIELNKCTLTSTASKEKHPVFDYSAGVENNKFYMFTGGFKEKNNLHANPVFKRTPNIKTPDINFAALPDK